MDNLTRQHEEALVVLRSIRLIWRSSWEARGAQRRWLLWILLVSIAVLPVYGLLYWSGHVFKAYLNFRSRVYRRTFPDQAKVADLIARIGGW